MELVIFSAWRATRHSIKKMIPPQWLSRTTVLVPMMQYRSYRRRLPRVIKVIGHDQFGIGNTKQWMVDNVDLFGRYVCLLDDDLVFSVRKDGRLLKADASEVNCMFFILETWMKEFGFAHCGVSARAGNNQVQQDYATNTRMMRVVGLDLQVVRELGARYDRTKGDMEDFDMNLQLLEAGYQNRVSYVYAAGQGATNTKGGVSHYRTWESHRQAAFMLKKLHPRCVRVITGKNWDGLGDKKERVDVRVLWNRAFRPRRVKAAIFDWGG